MRGRDRQDDACHTKYRGGSTTALVAIESWLDVRNSDRVSPCRCVGLFSLRLPRQRLLLPRPGSGIWSLYRSSGGRGAEFRGGPSSLGWQSGFVLPVPCSACECQSLL